MLYYIGGIKEPGFYLGILFFVLFFCCLLLFFGGNVEKCAAHDLTTSIKIECSTATPTKDICTQSQHKFHKSPESGQMKTIPSPQFKVLALEQGGRGLPRNIEPHTPIAP